MVNENKESQNDPWAPDTLAYLELIKKNSLSRIHLALEQLIEETKLELAKTTNPDEIEKIIINTGAFLNELPPLIFAYNYRFHFKAQIKKGDVWIYTSDYPFS